MFPKEAPQAEEIEIMDRQNANELPLARKGWFEGFITRGGVLRLLEMLAALEMY
jgi:hypothetical protein